MLLVHIAYLLLCTSEVLGLSSQSTSLPIHFPNVTLPSINETFVTGARGPAMAVKAKSADHLLSKDPKSTQKSTTEVVGIAADPSLPQAPFHPTESPSSTSGISVQHFPSRPTEGASSVGGSLPNTKQHQGLAVVAQTADSLDTSLRKGYTGSDPTFEPGKPVATDIHRNQVSPDRPTQVSNLPAPVKEPFKPDTGNPSSPTESPERFLIQGQTLTQGEALTHLGTLISLASDGSQLIVGTSTQVVALAPSVTLHGDMLPVLQPLQAIHPDDLTSQPFNDPTLESGLSFTMTDVSSLVAANEAPITAGASNTVIVQPFGILQSSGLPSESQSAVSEQSFIHGHTLAASGSVSVSGTLISLGPGLPSIVMGTQVQATGSHGMGRHSRGSSNGTSPLAFQGSATEAHVIRGGFVTVMFSALISMFLV